MRFIPYQAGRAIIEPTPETIKALEEVIRWAEVEAPSQLKMKMNELVFYMALVNQRFARKMSFGPLDPGGRNSAQAWRLPVRRISERYYLGWKVKQIRPAVWQLYNDSREAYFIEFGINWLGGNRRMRRPVRKLTLRQTLTFMMTTTAYHRVWADIFSSPRHANKGYGFSQIVQAPGGGHGRWMNISQHVAEGVVRANARQGRFSPEIRRLGGQFQRFTPNRGSGPTGPILGRRLP